jgi:hypothetical protein
LGFLPLANSSAMNAAAVFTCGFASCGGCEVSCVLTVATLSSKLFDVGIEETAVSFSAKASVLADSEDWLRLSIVSTITSTSATMANNPASRKILCFVKIGFIISPNPDEPELEESYKNNSPTDRLRPTDKSSSVGVHLSVGNFLAKI